MDVADAVERRDHVGCEFARLFEHGVDEILGQIAVEALVERALEPCRVLERESDVADRHPIGHGLRPRAMDRPGCSRSALPSLGPTAAFVYGPGRL